MRIPASAWCLSLLAACGGSDRTTERANGDAPVVDAVADDPVADERLLTLQSGGCAACHTMPDAVAAALEPSGHAPLERLALRGSPVGQSASSLAQHYAGDDAADIAAWLAASAPQATPVTIAAGAIERGGKLADELACAACHTPDRLDLAGHRSYEQVRTFLADPASVWPGLAHVALEPDEAELVAAFLLRQQRQEGASAPGFGYAYHELRIDDGDEPDLGGREPKRRGAVASIGTAPAERANHYALVFEATLDVPAAGEWTFSTNSDDGSWLWIDGEQVVANPGLKPARRARGRVRLDAGVHQLRIVYTQAGGGAVLDATWAGPGVDEQPLPAERASTTALALVPPPRADVDEAAAERGRAALRAHRCDACHPAGGFVDLSDLPAPAPVAAWAELAEDPSSCPSPSAGRVRREVLEVGSDEVSAATELALRFAQDGCLSCHRRDGDGGLDDAVHARLTEVEDIGDEGVLPPDLTLVGRRLRPAWLERVVAEGHGVRDYVRMRMPAFGPERGARYAELFAAVDAPGLDDAEPAFTEQAAELGRKLAGTGGRNCISCHRMSGHASLGPQGLDLAHMHQRLRPQWFRDWLLHPQELRPGTRMPKLWVRGDERDAAEADAIRTWLSLGAAAPLPHGLAFDPASLVLEPVDRPVLHGAFLQDVSARCLCVGTPERTHFAFDLARPRLVWLWRGSFVDARGTWHGRAGQLVSPLGTDHVVLDDFTVGGEGERAPRRLLGQRRTSDGYPVLRVACGEARWSDEVRPRLASSGSEVVRRLTCEQGPVVFEFPETSAARATVDGAPAGRHELATGDTLEVVYRW